MAGPFLKAAVKSDEALDEEIRVIDAQLRIAMLSVGAENLDQLRHTPLQKVD
jgi:isopentenyl diphosphate isomerase/L-lactate dehydrogenase-like FMN-dependent dehydrogenase